MRRQQLQLRASKRKRLSMEMMESSLDPNNNNGNGDGSRSDDNLLSDAADCSLMPPPTSSRNGGTKSNAASSSSAAAATEGDDNANHCLTARKKWKGGSKRHHVDNTGSEASSSSLPSPLQQNSPKTLFSAVMSLTNTNPPSTQDDAHNDGEGTTATTLYSNNVATSAATTTTTTTNSSSTTTAPSLDNKNIHNTTPQKPSDRKNSNNLHKSPIFSPGGYEILKALDGANLYAYQEHKIGDVMESDDDDNGRLAEEWQDATIFFSDECAHNSNNAIFEKIEATTTDDYLTDNITDAQKYHDSHQFLDSSMVEATKHVADFVDIQQCTKNNLTIPEPIGVGVLDWSLKRRLRLECLPGRCLPQSLPSSSSCSMDEGFLHHLAIQYLSNRDDSGRTWSHKTHSFSRDVAMAKWLASMMYYQHPAVHPLPTSMLSSKDVGVDRNNGKTDLSSSLVGPHSIHNRVRLSAAGCMGGLGISVVPSDRISKAENLGRLDRRSSNSDKSSITTVSSLLYQRRREWQQAFRSMFHSWKSKLKRIQESREDEWLQLNKRSTTPVEDDVSRCSFYAILPHQIILFRGGFVDGANDGNRWQLDRRKKSDDDASQAIVPMIVFSSTTSRLRSKLKSMGVDLKVFSQNNHNDVDKGKNCEILFSESLLDTANTGVAFGEGDAESVQSDLEIMKLENNDKEQVRVEIKKKRNQHQKVGKTGCVDLPPLFVCGDDDCATVYELLVNTYGLSVGLETNVSKGGSESVSLDVPLLLCRSLGPCMHTSLRTLSFSSRRDCDFLSQVQTNVSNIQRDENSTAKAALELRGPILPCALRDMTCAVVSYMMLDKCTQSSNTSHKKSCDQFPNMYSECDPSMAASSHQFLMSFQTHEGECSRSVPKSTGSSSSTEFNGTIPLTSTQMNHSIRGPTAWSQCGHGDYVDKLVWDISRNSVVSFHTCAATP